MANYTCDNLLLHIIDLISLRDTYLSTIFSLDKHEMMKRYGLFTTNVIPILHNHFSCYRLDVKYHVTISL